MKSVVCLKYSLILRNVNRSVSVITHKGCLYGTLILALQGCANNPASQPDAYAVAALAQSTLVQKLGTASVNASVQVSDIRLLGTDTVKVGPAYFAASGRTCRRLMSESGVSLDRIVCLNKGDGWYLPRALISRVTGLSVPASASVEPAARLTAAQRERADTVPDGRTERRYTVARGETLWSFSKRTTGNSRNWKEIARYNRIDDASKLPEGTSLVIPLSLQ